MQLQERFAWAGLMLVLVSAVMMTWASFDLRPPDHPYQRGVTDKAGKNHQPGIAPAVPDGSGANREKPAEPDWANPNCENPGNHDEADLCEQRRMSRSADDTYRLNRFQVYLGIIGAIVVVAGLYYARKAAIAALEAAKHAGEQAAAALVQTKIAEDALMKVQRPYVFIYGVDHILANRPVDGKGGKIPFIVANYGQTPAIIEWVDSDICVGPTPQDIVPFAHNPWEQNPLFKPAEVRDLEHPFPAELDSESRNVFHDARGSTIQPLVPKGSHLFFRVKIGYRGPLTSDHDTEACWIFDENEASFVLYGDDGYNYTR